MLNKIGYTSGSSPLTWNIGAMMLFAKSELYAVTRPRSPGVVNPT